jgi:hypothetical protein
VRSYEPHDKQAVCSVDSPCQSFSAKRRGRNALERALIWRKVKKNYQRPSQFDGNTWSFDSGAITHRRIVMTMKDWSYIAHLCDFTNKVDEAPRQGTRTRAGQVRQSQPMVPVALLPGVVSCARQTATRVA